MGFVRANVLGLLQNEKTKNAPLISTGFAHERKKFRMKQGLHPAIVGFP